MEWNRSLGMELRSLTQAVRRKMDANLGEMKPECGHATGMHIWVLSYLYDNGDREVFQRDFEQQFSIRRSTATRMLQLMERNGLIRRESVPSDARLKKLVLTEKAVQMHERMIASLRQIEVQLLQDFTEEEKQTLFRLLEKARNNIQ